MKISEIKSEEVRNEAVRLAIEATFPNASNAEEALELSVESAFEWMCTPQGVDFWSKIGHIDVNNIYLKLPKQEIMKIDLSKKQVGDTLFTAHDGWDEITEISKGHLYPIMTETRSNFGLDGRYCHSDRHPTAFNSREEFDEYWAQVK